MSPNRWRIFWGGILVIFGILLLLSNLQIVPFGLADVFRFGWPLFLILLGVLVLVPGSGGGWSWTPGASTGKRDQTFNGKEIHDLNVSHGLGDYNIDLARAIFPPGTAHVKASHGLGDLNILLPANLPVKVKATVGIGDVSVFGEEADGMGATIEKVSSDFESASSKLELEATLGIGDLGIVRSE